MLRCFLSRLRQVGMLCLPLAVVWGWFPMLVDRSNVLVSRVSPLDALGLGGCHKVETTLGGMPGTRFDTEMLVLALIYAGQTCAEHEGSGLDFTSMVGDGNLER